MKPEELQAKIKIYQEALENIKQELASKRTELSALAKKKVGELESSIPVLQAENDKLRKESVDLSAQIESKRKQFSQKQEDLEAQYNKLVDKLVASHDKSMSEVERVANKNKADYESYQERLAALIRAEERVESKKQGLNETQAYINNSLRALDDKKSAAMAEVEKANSELNEKIKEFNARTEALKGDIKAFENKVNLVKSKEAAAEQILARIEEARTILNLAKELEVKTANEKAEVNQANAKNIADNRKNIIREELLDQREQKLNERENNIKAAEASLKV